MKSTTVRVICVLTLAGAACGVFAQRHVLSRLRVVNGQLRQSGPEVQRLTAEHAEIDRLRAEVEEIEKLRHETRELHKLRNEVRQLREQKPEWDKLQAQNQKLRAGSEPAGQPASRAPDPASLLAKEVLSDAGFGSPEATLRTYFWAMREGNMEKMRSCFSPDISKEIISDGPGSAFKGFRVVAKKVLSSDDVKLGIQFFAEQGAPAVEFVLPFKRVDGEWKLSMAP